MARILCVLLSLCLPFVCFVGEAEAKASGSKKKDAPVMVWKELAEPGWFSKWKTAPALRPLLASGSTNDVIKNQALGMFLCGVAQGQGIYPRVNSCEVYTKALLIDYGLPDAGEVALRTLQGFSLQQRTLLGVKAKGFMLYTATQVAELHARAGVPYKEEVGSNGTKTQVVDVPELERRVAHVRQKANTSLVRNQAILKKIATDPTSIAEVRAATELVLSLQALQEAWIVEQEAEAKKRAADTVSIPPSSSTGSGQFLSRFLWLLFGVGLLFGVYKGTTFLVRDIQISFERMPRPKPVSFDTVALVPPSPPLETPSPTVTTVVKETKEPQIVWFPDMAELAALPVCKNPQKPSIGEYLVVQATWAHGDGKEVQYRCTISKGSIGSTVLAYTDMPSAAGTQYIKRFDMFGPNDVLRAIKEGRLAPIAEVPADARPINRQRQRVKT